MDSSDDFSAILSASLAELAAAGTGESVRNAIARAIKHLSVYRILELRQKICSELDEKIPAVRETLELLDGQLALREIGRDAGWR
jgi:hypothetical protein